MEASKLNNEKTVNAHFLRLDSFQNDDKLLALNNFESRQKLVNQKFFVILSILQNDSR